MEYTFPASEIHTIRSMRVGTYRTHTIEVGDNIVVTVPDNMTCTVTALEGVLTLVGDGSNATVTGDLNFFQGGFVAGDVSTGSQMIQIKVPPYKVNLRSENIC